MTDPAYELQLAVAAALLADAGVEALVGQAVYDDLSAPESSYPRISIGADQTLMETNTSARPCRVISTYHIWCNGPDGRLKAKQIRAALIDVLAPAPTTPPTPSALSLNGWKITSALPINAHDMTSGDATDPGGLVAHSVAEIEFHLTPAL